jgi:hypothetical protein
MLKDFNNDITSIKKKLQIGLSDTLYNDLIIEKKLTVDGTEITIPAFKESILNGTKISTELINAFNKPIPNKDAFNAVEIVIPTLLIQSLIHNLESYKILPQILRSTVER